MDLDRAGVLELIETLPRPADRLRTDAPPGVLAEIVLDRRESWWVRRTCARALDGRVPAEHVAELFARARDEHDGEVVRALVDVLATTQGTHRDDLLDWLRAQEGVERLTPTPERLLRARAPMGDLDAAEPLGRVRLGVARWAA
ncbi:hypothetical protein [Pseudonocardia zijingensis]|uniref:Uncharacterized protein n=1 Tax=Pseudonocardia zijingensis TaxID=153376 RepID=A0ABP4ATY3_9PSEU